ncbi:MAG: tripartite tricarboxylate transporter TctB family protein [Eubacteriales bacterium]
MNGETKKELFSSALLMIASLLMIVIIIPTGVSIQNLFFSSDSIINGRTMPYIASALIFLSSLTQFLKTYFAYRKGVQEESEFLPTKADRIRVIAVMLLFVAFVVLFCTVGTIIAIVVILPLILYAAGVRKISYYAIIYLFAAICYVLFVYLLQIYLP